MQPFWNVYLLIVKSNLYIVFRIRPDYEIYVAPIGQQIPFNKTNHIWQILFVNLLQRLIGLR